MMTLNVSPTRPRVDTPVDRGARHGLDLLGHDAVHPRMVFLPETAETDAVDALVLGRMAALAHRRRGRIREARPALG